VFESTWVSVELDADNLLTPDLRYKATWTATVDGVDVSRVQLFDVVRVPPVRLANGAGFRDYASTLVDDWVQSATASGDWEPRLEAAFERIVRDLDSRGIRANGLVDWQDAAPLTYERALLALCEEGYTPAGGFEGNGKDWSDLRLRRYRDEFEKFCGSIPAYDADGSGTIEPAEVDVDRSTSQFVR
jgi:hypothetical protein